MVHTKKAWYAANGLRPYDEPDAPGQRGVLIWTDDQAGVNQPAWREIAPVGPGLLRNETRRQEGGGKAAVILHLVQQVMIASPV